MKGLGSIQIEKELNQIKEKFKIMK